MLLLFAGAENHMKWFESNLLPQSHADADSAAATCTPGVNAQRGRVGDLCTGQGVSVKGEWTGGGGGR